MKKILDKLTLREKISLTAAPTAGIRNDKNAKNPYGVTWSVGGLQMAFANMDFTPRDDLIMKADEYIEIVKEANEARKVPILSAMDCTSGINGAFYEFNPITSAPMIGAANDCELAYKFGEIRARSLKRAGARWWWGPEVDLSSRKSEIMWGRIYSDEPEKLSKLAIAEMKGCQDCGVAATVKHFPGQDEMEDRDPHSSLQMLHCSYDKWKKRQGKLFQDLIDAGVCSVMSAHTSFPDYDSSTVNGKYRPASVSYKIITELLKGEMGFDGVVITDGIEMKGLASMFNSMDEIYIEAFNAGNDVILGVRENYVDVIEKAINDHVISIERLNDACLRILNLMKKVGLFEDGGIMVNMENIDKINEDIKKLNSIVADKSMTLVNNRKGLLPLKEKPEHITAVVLSSDKNLEKVIKNGIGKSFEKRDIKFDVTTDLFSLEQMKEIDEKSDLIIYVACRRGKYKYFDIDDNESFNYILTYGAEKSMGVSFADPYVYYDRLFMLDSFVNVYDLNDESQECFVKAILGEIQFAKESPFNIVPREHAEYEKTQIIL